MISGLPERHVNVTIDFSTRAPLSRDIKRYRASGNVR